MITESPLKNIFEMNLSRLTVRFPRPLPGRGISIHISRTFSIITLQCRSNAFTLPKSFLLLRQLISTWVLFFIEFFKIANGPVLNSSCSFVDNSWDVISDFGFVSAALILAIYKGKKIRIGAVKFFKYVNKRLQYTLHPTSRRLICNVIGRPTDIKYILWRLIIYQFFL